MTLPTPGRRTLATLVLVGASLQTFAASSGAVQAPERPPYWRERTSFFHTFGHRADVVMVGDSLTDGVLARLDDVLGIKPKVVFLMIGINDFAEATRSVDAVFATYRSIVSRLERGGIRVVVQSTLPCNETKGAWKSCSTINGKILQLNARLATLAAARVSYVDLLPVLAARSGLRDEFTYDGVHLNGDGYQRWKDAITRFMPRPPEKTQGSVP